MFWSKISCAWERERFTSTNVLDTECQHNLHASVHSSSIYYKLPSILIVLGYISLTSSILGDCLQEYSTLPSEGQWEVQDKKSLAHVWPSHGKVEFIDTYLTYRPDLKPALSGFTATINAGEHVGIVGRTGAGKSTIAVRDGLRVKWCMQRLNVLVLQDT